MKQMKYLSTCVLLKFYSNHFRTMFVSTIFINDTKPFSKLTNTKKRHMIESIRFGNSKNQVVHKVMLESQFSGRTML